jgi:lipopolysaccharide heptosyltransferase II
MKILIVTKNWIGDLLFQLPAIEAICRHYSEAEITCVVPSRCKEMLSGNEMIANILVFDERKEHKKIIDRIRFIRDLRKEKWEKVFLFHPSKTRALIMLLAGVERRIGFDLKKGSFLTDKIKAPSEPMHQVDYFLKLIEGVGIKPEKRKYSLSVSYNDESQAKGILKESKIQPNQFVCFHLGANWEPKRWPIENFARLAELLFKQTNFQIVVTGAERDSILALALQKLVPSEKLRVFTGKTSLNLLAAVFKQAAFVVSGDSGPMHIAVAVGTKNVALFGPTDPALTGPRGIGDSIVISYVPSGYRVPFYDQALPKDGWLGKISAEQVFEQIRLKGWLINERV